MPLSSKLASQWCPQALAADVHSTPSVCQYHHSRPNADARSSTIDPHLFSSSSQHACWQLISYFSFYHKLLLNVYSLPLVSTALFCLKPCWGTCVGCQFSLLFILLTNTQEGFGIFIQSFTSFVLNNCHHFPSYVYIWDQWKFSYSEINGKAAIERLRPCLVGSSGVESSVDDGLFQGKSFPQPASYSIVKG